MRHFLKILFFFHDKKFVILLARLYMIAFLFLAVTEANGILKIFFHVQINYVLLQFILACLTHHSEAFKRFTRNQWMFSFMCTQPQLPTLPNLKAERLDTALCQHAVIWQNIKWSKVFFKITIIIKKRNSLKSCWIAGKLFLCLIITEKRGLLNDRTSYVQSSGFHSCFWEKTPNTSIPHHYLKARKAFILLEFKRGLFQDSS